MSLRHKIYDKYACRDMNPIQRRKRIVAVLRMLENYVNLIMSLHYCFICQDFARKVESLSVMQNKKFIIDFNLLPLIEVYERLLCVDLFYERKKVMK
jgi:hypothetical protein